MDKKFECTLFDVLGRVILHSLEYTHQARIETSNLPSGTFWLQITLYEKVHWERVELVR